MRVSGVWIVGLVLVAALPVVTPTHDPNDFFALEIEFPGYDWFDIHGSSSTNVFAVGQNGGVSAIARRTGAGWAIQTGVPDIGVLNRVWTVSATQAYATPLESRLESRALEWDGASWTTLTTGMTRVNAVYGISSTNIAFLGSIPDDDDPAGNLRVSQVQIYNGATFGALIGCQVALTGTPWIFGNTASGNYYLESIRGVVGVTSRVASPYSSCDSISSVQTTVASNDAWGSDGTLANLWAVSTGGIIIDYQGDATPPLQATSPTEQDLIAIWGVASNNIWAVGSAGTVIHYDGSAWTLEPALSTAEELHGVYFSSATDGWTVSRSGDIFKLQVNPSVATPAVGVLNTRATGFQVSVYGTHCLGDKIGFAVNLDLAAGITIGDMDVTIINAETGVVIENIDDATMTNVANAGFYFQRTYPTGPYVALAVADLAGIGAIDYFDMEAFSVPAGSCFTAGDKQDILDRFAALDANVAWINATTLRTEANVTQVNLTVSDAHAHIDGHFTYQNLRENESRAISAAMHSYGFNLQNTTHSHIDAHFNNTWARQAYTNSVINATAVGLNVSIAEIIIRIDRNLTLLNLTTNNQGVFGLSSISTYTGPDSTVILLFFLLMAWAMFQGYFLVALMALLGAMLPVVEAFDTATTSFEHGFIITFALVLIAFWVESLLRGWRLRHPSIINGRK